MSRRPADGTRPPPRRGRAIRLLIRAYQLTLSGLVGRQCRYLPSCSDYAAEAIGLHGIWAGGWIAAARLCRCHPWGGWGYDPVPVRREPVPWWMPWRHGVRRPRDPERSGHERASNSAAKP